MTTLTEQVSIIRAKSPLSIAGIHYSLISTARTLAIHRRGAAAAATSMAVAAAAPAVASLRSRRTANFLFESELRRSDRIGAARATLRRLVASLLYWLPPGESGGGGEWFGAAAGAGGAGGCRPPGYGKLPRPVMGHEKTALVQFQVNTARARHRKGW